MKKLLTYVLLIFVICVVFGVVWNFSTISNWLFSDSDQYADALVDELRRKTQIQLYLKQSIVVENMKETLRSVKKKQKILAQAVAEFPTLANELLNLTPNKLGAAAQEFLTSVQNLSSNPNNMTLDNLEMLITQAEKMIEENTAEQMVNLQKEANEFDSESNGNEDYKIQKDERKTSVVDKIAAIKSISECAKIIAVFQKQQIPRIMNVSVDYETHFDNLFEKTNISIFDIHKSRERLAPRKTIPEIVTDQFELLERIPFQLFDPEGGLSVYIAEIARQFHNDIDLDEFQKFRKNIFEKFKTWWRPTAEAEFEAAVADEKTAPSLFSIATRHRIELDYGDSIWTRLSHWENSFLQNRISWTYFVDTCFNEWRQFAYEQEKSFLLYVIQSLLELDTWLKNNIFDTPNILRQDNLVKLSVMDIAYDQTNDQLYMMNHFVHYLSTLEEKNTINLTKLMLKLCTDMQGFLKFCTTARITGKKENLGKAITPFNHTDEEEKVLISWFDEFNELTMNAFIADRINLDLLRKISFSVNINDVRRLLYRIERDLVELVLISYRNGQNFHISANELIQLTPIDNFELFCNRIPDKSPELVHILLSLIYEMSNNKDDIFFLNFEPVAYPHQDDLVAHWKWSPIWKPSQKKINLDDYKLDFHTPRAPLELDIQLDADLDRYERNEQLKGLIGNFFRYHFGVKQFPMFLSCFVTENEVQAINAFMQQQANLYGWRNTLMFERFCRVGQFAHLHDDQLSTFFDHLETDYLSKWKKALVHFETFLGVIFKINVSETRFQRRFECFASTQLLPIRSLINSKATLGVICQMIQSSVYTTLPDARIPYIIYAMQKFPRNEWLQFAEIVTGMIDFILNLEQTYPDPHLENLANVVEQQLGSLQHGGESNVLGRTIAQLVGGYEESMLPSHLSQTFDYLEQKDEEKEK